MCNRKWNKREGGVKEKGQRKRKKFTQKMIRTKKKKSFKKTKWTTKTAVYENGRHDGQELNRNCENEEKKNWNIF